ncbi:hypothetical protein [Variovorax sp. LG9.2]|uniref:hypothetical protein n=1 Tax=Variovorax sp. LG9.2 TaxID=3048626 RepID=UPI002B22263B|nr:hypothetical protein [Variovorax sp. LG9.2]MEB0056711.1 hypothetical protein [Variovorax sp. LG9.2]
MLDNADLRHVAALVNTSKHRSVVGTPLSVSFVESELPHGLKFEAFEHRGKSYPQHWAVPFSKVAFDAIQQHMLKIGTVLNAAIEQAGDSLQPSSARSLLRTSQHACLPYPMQVCYILNV